MLDRARLTATTPCQRIRCVTLAKAWKSSDVRFSGRPMPHPSSDDDGLSSVAVRSARRTGGLAQSGYRPGTSVTDQTGSMGDTPLSCPPGGGHGVDGDGPHEGTAALRGGLGSEAVHGDRAVRPVRR